MRGICHRDISTMSENGIIDLITSVTENPNSQNTYFNLAILLKKHNDLNYTSLENYREENKLRIEKLRIIVNKKKKGKAPTLNQLKEHNNRLYREQNWRGFILDYLLNSLHVRNADLDIIVTISGRKLNSNENYLIIRKNSITYIRNDYKTSKTYGQKRNQIASKKFRHAILQFMGDDSQKFLLTNSENQRLTKGSINRYIQKYTFKGLSESDINRAYITAIDTKGNLNELKRYSKNRGTSIDTLIDNYNLNFKL